MCVCVVTESTMACLDTELVDKLFIDNLQSIGTTTLSKLLAVLQSQLLGHNHELLYLRLQSWRRPDDAADWLLQTLV